MKIERTRIHFFSDVFADANCCSFIDGITKPVTECYIKIVVISSHIGNLLHVAKLSRCIIIITLRYST